jgi:hypothetical protein
MQFHILTGDILAQSFAKLQIDGETIVSRECLIEGSLEGGNLPGFWQTRAEFIKSAYQESEESYNQKVKSEYEKLLAFAPDDTANLWFEYDLFCQVNMWFTLYLLNQSNISNIYRIAPTVRNKNDLWQGFGGLNQIQLTKCFTEKVQFEKDDISLGVNLWQAYKSGNLTELQQLSKIESHCFPYLKDVCAAEIARKTESRPEKTLKEIEATGVSNFHELFSEFSKKEGVYGFGDSQVKRILAATIKC